jgi:5-methylcytosine-specific restriction endonuclease McrA
VQRASLSSSQRDEILRRQAFQCTECRTDLEPVGKAPAHFEPVNPSSKHPSSAASFQALCPACYAKSGANPGKASDEQKRRQDRPGLSRSTTKFVKTGIDTRKF